MAADILARLKDFQRATVEFVFRRLYVERTTSRFLVADEVGLGKTLVAKGIIAKVIEHLQPRKERVDIVYICSNASIAGQNIRRLNIAGADGFTLPTRLTLLPLELDSLQGNAFNFISLTPGQAFELKKGGGIYRERAVIFRILRELFSDRADMCKGLGTLLQMGMGDESWKSTLKDACNWRIDDALGKAFHDDVANDAELHRQLEDLCRACRNGVPDEAAARRRDMVGKLRERLAAVCLRVLKPVLVIMDEFQRFKDLLDGNDLAQALFGLDETRVLLLSATPYKMFTLDAERLENAENDHYADFVRTLGFLYANAPHRVEEVKELLASHRAALRGHAQGFSGMASRKPDLEKLLLEVMCRTERADMAQGDSMLEECVSHPFPTKDDILGAADLDGLAQQLAAGDVLEYWKSAPYLLSFFRHYALRQRLDDRLDHDDGLVKRLRTLRKQKGVLLQRKKLDGYEQIDPANPRLRQIFADTIEKGMWQLLWMPPSMPYMRPTGPYAGKEGLTKALVFSAWNAVPDAIATLCSHEAERRMVGKMVGRLHDKEGSPRRLLYKQGAKGLDFALKAPSNGQGREKPGNMANLAWLLPFPTLAAAIDPLAIALQHGPDTLGEAGLRKAATEQCRQLMKRLPPADQAKDVDKRWYWAAPFLLEASSQQQDFPLKRWCMDMEGGPLGVWAQTRPKTDGGEDGEAESADAGRQREQNRIFKAHVERLVGFDADRLGRQPDDLAEVLCELALAAPGVCALRALRRITPDLERDDPALLSAAFRVSVGFRSLFSAPEAVALVRGTIRGKQYWRRALKYALAGNIQAMLDEYAHVLHESLGCSEEPPHMKVDALARAMYGALSLMASQVQLDELKKDSNGRWKTFNNRCRFALRFADIRGEDNKALRRADLVRDAFNSPFRPFVLASTSIGQEGLDFHGWCHAIVHWNLPSNPVDLEQREGRIHRYKGHAVRKNLAEKLGLAALCSWDGKGDPWEKMFALAANQRQPGCSELVPYWLFGGSAHIERRVPLLPFSREVARLKYLKRALALYRMVFGQPCQQDLLEMLDRGPQQPDLEKWTISLRPPQSLQAKDDFSSPCQNQLTG